VRKPSQLKISNRFAALENLNVGEDINRAWENIKENIKISAKESLGLHAQKQHKPWFDEECSRFLDRRKQAKIQWLQNPNQSNGDNLNDVRREASRHFKNKKKEYLKARINEPETNSKNENIRDLYRGINDFKRGTSLRTNVVKDEKGDLVADSHSVLSGCRNHFFQLLNVHGVNVRQSEVHAGEPLVPEPSAFEVEMAIEKLKRHKSPGIYQIPAELIKTGGRVIRSEIHKLKRRNCLRSGRNQSLCLFIRRVIKQIVVIIGAYHFCQLHTKFYPIFFCQV
jgi:hypothetical protein